MLCPSCGFRDLALSDHRGVPDGIERHWCPGCGFVVDGPLPVPAAPVAVLSDSEADKVFDSLAKAAVASADKVVQDAIDSGSNVPRGTVPDKPKKKVSTRSFGRKSK